MDPIFATIAARYDLVSGLLSFGQEARWKRWAVAMVPRAERRARTLDLATGTGGFPLCLGRAGLRGTIVALDRSPEMLAIARRRCAGGPPVTFVRGDLASLPFTEEQFDLVTLGYGLRYVPDVHRTLAQAFSLLRPGGCFVCLDLNLPTNALFRRAYLGYLFLFGSLWGLSFHGKVDEYWHIVESLRAFAGGAAVARWMAEVGFVDVRYIAPLGGVAMILSGRRPFGPPDRRQETAPTGGYVGQACESTPGCDSDGPASPRFL